MQKDWITINGTHVFVGDDGNIQYGPSNLKGGGSEKTAESYADKHGVAYTYARTALGMQDKVKAEDYAAATTASKIKSSAARVVQYNDHSIALTEHRDSDGKASYELKVYDNDGTKRYGDFQSDRYWATDADAMNTAIEWARITIDEREGKNKK